MGWHGPIYHWVMAQVERRLPENVSGDFVVDASCIDCDTCRQIAPATFRDHGGQSSVHAQPATPATTLRALMVLVACPTASISAASHLNARAGVQAFPEPIVDNVYFCGFIAEASFGAWSYLVVRAERDGGNVLVDSPRFFAPLVRQIDRLGGVRLMVLSHWDDIADHAKFAAYFECPRVMHEADGAQRLGIERVVTGEDAGGLDGELLCVPTPGHTRGTRFSSTATRSYLRATTSPGQPDVRHSQRLGTSAGTPGRSRRGRWKSSSPTSSSGCFRVMAASITPRAVRCAIISDTV